MKDTTTTTTSASRSEEEGTEDNNNNGGKSDDTTTSSSNVAMIITPLPDPIKGNADWRSYRCFELPNGVTAVCVCDKESKTTAAAAVVAAGAASDPRLYPGVAHFTEHMCFLGSDKYPGENQYKRYLSVNGGRSNASTSMYVTTYKFEVVASAAETALDMFARCFVAPLFTESGTRREIYAVDSENSKNLTADVRRRLQMLKAEVTDHSHYFSKFSTGNAVTLGLETAKKQEKEDDEEEKEDETTNNEGTDASANNANATGGTSSTTNGGNVSSSNDDDDSNTIATGKTMSTTGSLSSEEDEDTERERQNRLELLRQLLLAFHAHHYRPERFTVVVAGPQSLDTLQEWVVPRFAPIQARTYPPQEEEEEAGGGGAAAGGAGNGNNNNNGIVVKNSGNNGKNKKKTSAALRAKQNLALEMVQEAAEDAPAMGFKHYQNREAWSAENAVFHSPYASPELDDDPSNGNNVGRWPTVMVCKPVRSMRRLVLMFPLPSVQRVPDESPVRLLSHLIGHEGPNTPFSALQQDAGWIDQLSAGSRWNAPDFCVFEISASLTESGEDAWHDVASVLFAYCRYIAEQSSTSTGQEELRRIWGESASLGRLFFHQKSPGSVYGLVPQLASSVHLHGTAKCLCAGSKLRENAETLNLQALQDFCSRLVPENCMVERCSHAAWDEMVRNERRQKRRERQQEQQGQHDATLDGNDGGEQASNNNKDNKVRVQRKTEPWYGMDYYVSSIPPDRVAQWKGESSSNASSADVESMCSQLQLPRPNRYIPESLELCPELPDEAKGGPRIDKPMDPPALLVDTTTTRTMTTNNDAGSGGLPVVAQQKLGGRCWHRLDDRYALPKAHVTILIRNAAVHHSLLLNDDTTAGDGAPPPTWQYDTRSALLSDMIRSMFVQAMAVETYDADLAGLHWDLNLLKTGIQIHCFGFSDRLPELALFMVRQFFGNNGNTCGGEDTVTTTSNGNDDNTDGGDNKEAGWFVREPYFTSTKERTLRNLKTYWESRRADAHANYYRDFFLHSNGSGVDAQVRMLEGDGDDDDDVAVVSVASCLEHYRRMVSNPEQTMECLCSGNVSAGTARDVFEKVSNLLSRARHEQQQHQQQCIRNDNDIDKRDGASWWIPGGMDRRLEAGRSVELHFASQNPQEQNGAVVVTYQSQIPSFHGFFGGCSSSDHNDNNKKTSGSTGRRLWTMRRGAKRDVDSYDDYDRDAAARSRNSSAAIRLICHMLREPFFNELRTKQTLGYLVNSHYDIGVSYRQEQQQNQPQLQDNVNVNNNSCRLAGTTPVDYIVLTVLSRTVPPTEVLNRMDAFIAQFRDILRQMPDSEMEHHATALTTKLLKPIAKLEMEHSNRCAKITRYAPQVAAAAQMRQQQQKQQQQQATTKTTTATTRTTTTDDNIMPWDLAQDLADAISELKQGDLVETWDRITSPQTRARVVSCVYGSTFSLESSLDTVLARSTGTCTGGGAGGGGSGSAAVVNNDGNDMEGEEKVAVAVESDDARRSSAVVNSGNGKVVVAVVNDLSKIIALRRRFAVYDHLETPYKGGKKQQHCRTIAGALATRGTASALLEWSRSWWSRRLFAVTTATAAGQRQTATAAAATRTRLLWAGFATAALGAGCCCYYYWGVGNINGPRQQRKTHY